MTRSITSKLIVLLTLALAVILSAGMAIDYRLSRDEIISRLQLESLDTINVMRASGYFSRKPVRSGVVWTRSPIRVRLMTSMFCILFQPPSWTT